MIRHPSRWVHLFGGGDAMMHVFLDEMFSEEGIGTPFDSAEDEDNLPQFQDFSPDRRLSSRDVESDVSPAGRAPVGVRAIQDDFEEAEEILRDGGYASLSHSDVLERLRMYPAGVEYLRCVRPVGEELALG